MTCKLKVGKAFLRRVIGVLGMGFALISAPAIPAGNDNAAVMAANAAFYAALNKIFAGDAGPMKAVWFRKEGGQWKMVGHQTDPLPYLIKPAK